ncbi:MAG: RluA family pseudouridine synthase [Deltaproteobacteria bacterium]|nr:RluA family pseudouridine synthase [Deltaproteobacteria bacterium]
MVTHHGFALHPDDSIEIHSSSQRTAAPKGGIQVLFQDESLVGILKPEGLLSVGTQDVKLKHALAMVRESLGPNQKLWPVHRLDRETSGVLLFARSREVCDAVKKSWQEVTKTYSVVVEGHPAPPEGVINQPLYDGKNLMVKVGSHSEAKEAITRYKTLETGPRRTLLEVHLDTGRRHQIRAHMSWLGHTVVGDTRYGKKDSRMALHARRLCFQHPITGKEIVLEAKTPAVFMKQLASVQSSRTRSPK